MSKVMICEYPQTCATRNAPTTPPAGPERIVRTDAAAAVCDCDENRLEAAWEKYRAPLLPWWAALTEGFQKCRLAVEQVQQAIEQVKQWMARSIGPMLAVVHQVAGPSFIHEVIRAGQQRWRSKHRALLTAPPRKQIYVLHPA